MRPSAFIATVGLALTIAAVGVGATRALFLDTGPSSGNVITSDFIIAFDNFESSDYTGGFGWLDNWSPTGAVSVTTGNSPYEGSYHLQVDKGATVVRSVDLSGQTLMRFQLRSKVTGLTGSRQAHAEISSDGSVWNEIRTWTSADPVSYQYEDVDLSPYTMSTQFWVRLSVDSGGNPKLFADNVTYASRQALPATATPTATNTPTPTPTPTDTPTPTPTATPTPAPPAPPANLAATPGDSEIVLDWDDNTEPDLAGYNVYRSTTMGGPYSKVNGPLVSVSTYTDTGLSNGTTYYYMVRAENTVPLESGNSNEVSETPTSTPPTPTPTPTPTATPTPTPTPDPIAASDDLESGDLIGGTGWLDNWTIVAPVTATSASSPHGGTFHMQVDKGAEAKRSVDLSGRTGMRWRFWAKVTVFRARDRPTPRSARTAPTGPKSGHGLRTTPTACTRLRISTCHHSPCRANSGSASG